MSELAMALRTELSPCGDLATPELVTGVEPVSFLHTREASSHED